MKTAARLVALASLLASCLPLAAASFSYTGTFTHDDDKQFFTFTTSVANQVITIRTFGFAGGTNHAAAVIPAGGFDPTIQFFDGTGLLYGLNQDGGCPDVNPDPATSYCWDSYYFQPVAAGTYTLVLTEYDNQAFGPSLVNGFSEDGQGDFTGPLFLGQPGSFILISGEQRTGAWALDISGVDSATLGPTLPVTLTGFSAE